MKRSLIFHIGAHRTGTSAVQNYLHHNRVALRQQGLFYPFGARRHVHRINQLFSGACTPQALSADLLARIKAQEERAGALELHRVVLSDEDICMRQDIGILGEFRSEFTVKVVFSLRRQDLWLESWYLQNIKWQWNPRLSHCSLPEFLARRAEFHWIDYDCYLRHLEKIFGRENVIVTLYEPGQLPPGGAVEMFCKAIGLQLPPGFRRAEVVNPSFSPEVSEFMRCLPLDEAPEKYRAILTAACAQIDAKRGEGKRGEDSAAAPVLLIPATERAAILASYARGNQAVARRYFDRDDLFLDPAPDPAAPLAQMRLPEDSYQLMEEFVTPLLQAMIRRRRQEVHRRKPR
ncbi:hypothetical protein [Pseudophaeobacter sp.]|uniref:hypothetical protein n=1 Tax=Pseudophaeobacter sp. TaxID=1971739 RepID=UPI003296C848